MKLCYVLTVDDAGAYANLTHMSVLSAGLTNPSLPIEIVCDPESYSWLKTERHPLVDCLVNFVVVDNPYGRSVAGSRYLKTTLRRHIQGDFLFLDADTLVVGDLGQMKHCRASFAAALDRSWHEPFPHTPELFAILEDRLGWLFDTSRYLNSGVMFVRDNPEAYALFDEWNTLWQLSLAKGYHFDQIPLNAAAARAKISVKVLDYRYNGMVHASPYFFIFAKIIHYYASCKIDTRVIDVYLALAKALRENEPKSKQTLNELVKRPYTALRYVEKRRFITHVPVRPIFMAVLAIRRLFVNMRERW
ncbi:MAG: putative nucleotide-diphospho-sugar transferase [bacterium]